VKGRTVTFTIEVGPIEFHNYSPQDESRAIARTRREMDAAIRAYWKVGPRSKTVCSEVSDA
jgi:hypothetical protein